MVLNPPCRHFHGASVIASIPVRCSKCNCLAATVVSISPPFTRPCVHHAFTNTDLLKRGQHVLKSHQILGRNPSPPKPRFRAGRSRHWGPRLHGCPEENRDGKAPGMAYSPSKEHLQGDNLMDVVGSAFSIHNLYEILSGKVQMHNECMS